MVLTWTIGQEFSQESSYLFLVHGRAGKPWLRMLCFRGLVEYIYYFLLWILCIENWLVKISNVQSKKTFHFDLLGNNFQLAIHFKTNNDFELAMVINYIWKLVI
jgi:hypothetical protein